MSNPDALFVNLAVQRGLATPETAQACMRQVGQGQGLARLLADRAQIPLDVARELHAEAVQLASRPAPPPPSTAGYSAGPQVAPVGRDDDGFSPNAPTVVGDIMGAAAAEPPDPANPQGTGFTPLNPSGTAYPSAYGSYPSPSASSPTPGASPLPGAPAPGAAGRFGDPFAPPTGYSTSGSHLDARTLAPPPAQSPAPGQSAGPGGTHAEGSVHSSSGSLPHMLPVGSQFGRYRLEQELGRGAMGIVWRARQVDLDRDVAIKMLLQGPVASDKVRSRFMAEARSVARLVHPNIVAIHDVGERDGIHFFTMDYVDGPPLSEYVKSNAVSVERALEIGRDIAEALDYAHQSGIVHRDLKPANVLLNQQGTARITDFGIAKDTTVESHTQAGEMLGTPAYMSPEQASGRSDTVDGRADVYALGAILYRILTGKPPFEGKTPYDVIRKVAVEKPVPPRKLNGQIPREVDAIVMRCLAKERDDRYASAGELAKALEQARRAVKPGRRSAPAGDGLLLKVLHVVLICIGLGGVGAAVWWRFLGGAGGRGQVVEASPTPELSDEELEGAVSKAQAAQSALEAGGDYAQAKADAEEACQQAPGRVEVHAALAAILLAGGEPQPAFERAEQALTIDADDLLARTVRGRALLALERPAAEIREEALRLEALGTGGQIASAELLAEHALTLSSYSVAIEHLREAVSLDPSAPERRLRLAEVYLEAGRHEQAEQEAKQVLARDKASAAAMLVRAKALEALGKRGEARDQALEALGINPELTEARELARKLEDVPATPSPTATRRPPPPSHGQGDPQNLHQACHQALQRAMQAVQQRDPNQAIQLYKQGFQDPNFTCADGLLLRAQVGMMLGQFPLAVRDLESLHQHHGAQPKTLSMLAQALAMTGQIEPALAAVEQFEQLAPGDPGIHLTRGKIFEKAERYEECAQAWRAFGAAVPQSPDGPHEAGHAWEKAGKPAEAVKDFQLAVERDPQNGHLQVALGKALDACDRGDEALRAYEAALKLPQLSPQDRAIAEERTGGQ